MTCSLHQPKPCINALGEPTVRPFRHDNSRMDLKRLTYFVHAAELGSFTRASSFLQVAQPALSRQVRSLEVELRQPLLERIGRSVTLTEPGKRLLAHAQSILRVERARHDLEDQRGAEACRLAIALPPSVGRTLTEPLMAAFRERLPKAALNAIRSSGHEAAFTLRPIGTPPLQTTLSIATSAQRPRGPLIEQATGLVHKLLVTWWR